MAEKEKDFDCEAQQTKPTRRISRKITSNFQKPFHQRNRSSSGTFAEGSCSPGSTLQSAEEQHALDELFGLLIGSQPADTITPLGQSCQWYKTYLERNIQELLTLFESILDHKNLGVTTPKYRSTSLGIKFVYEVARLLLEGTEDTKTDLALSDVVDCLENRGIFKQDGPGEDNMYLTVSGPRIEEPGDRRLANQAVFAVIGWLLLLWEFHPQQFHPRKSPDLLYIKHTRTTSTESQMITEDRNVKDHVEKPLYQLLIHFRRSLSQLRWGNQSGISNLENQKIKVQDVCFSTINHAELKIEWVDTLALHLELDAERQTLKVFRYPSYCRLMMGKDNIHHGLIFDHVSKIRDDQQDQVETRELFHEILRTYRLIFAQDDKSRRTFLRILPQWKQQWCSTDPDSTHDMDPLLEQLCGRSSTDPTSRQFWNEIGTDPEGNSYHAFEDFPYFGGRLLKVQDFVIGFKPQSLRAMLTDGRDRLARWKIWTEQTLLVFACLAVLLSVLQMAIQAWALVIAKQQLQAQLASNSISIGK